MRSLTLLTCLLLAAGCASGPRPGAPTEEVEGYVYPRPLDEVLPETASLLTEQGWKVQRSGDQLGTGWRGQGTGTATGLRVDGVRIDVDHCRIRIEGIDAVSLGPAIEDRQSRQGSVSSELSSGSDRIDARTTLGTAPSGLVALPRGRDTALEWALLQRLDPRAAQALERLAAQTPAQAATLPGSTDSPPGPSNAPPPGCGPPVLAAEPMIAGRRLVLLADAPGTPELGRFIRALTCRATERGIRTVVVLDLPRTNQELVDTYLAARGSTEDRAAFLQLAPSFGAYTNGGGGDPPALALLDALRGMRDAGAPVRVVLFGEPPDSIGRDRTQAKTVERLRRSAPDSLVLVAVRTADGAAPLDAAAADLEPVRSLLDRWGLHPVTLDIRASGPAPAASRASAGGDHASK